ncbi:hypothetical protein ACHHYP_15130 [Achlya hypogyna]|uniref:EF-hand domain-containing protein n=1 Tax=Achlya hypogyna TaxID=1202772 RepID=A0A1V9ZFH0_ACHHY|nr:hypothetical protein ACHHYP_15130 [Achlya hypogyna]
MTLTTEEGPQAVAAIAVDTVSQSGSPPKPPSWRDSHVSVGQVLARSTRRKNSLGDPTAAAPESSQPPRGQPAPVRTTTPSAVPKLTDYVGNFRRVLKELIAQGTIITNNKHLYTEQGNLAFYTRKNVSRRLHLRKNPELCRLTRLFWASVVPHTSTTMDVEGYERLFLRIHKVLAKRFGVDASTVNIHEDWRRDTNGDERGLSYDMFHAALFELIDAITRGGDTDGVQLKPLRADVRALDTKARPQSAPPRHQLPPPAVALSTTPVAPGARPEAPMRTSPKAKQPTTARPSSRSPTKPHSSPSKPHSSPSKPRSSPPKPHSSPPKPSPRHPTAEASTQTSRTSLHADGVSTEKAAAIPTKTADPLPAQSPLMSKATSPLTGATQQSLSLDDDRRPVLPSPPKPNGFPRQRPKSSPLKRSSPPTISGPPPFVGKVHNSSVLYIDINTHAISPINFDFDVDKAVTTRPHVPTRTRPPFHLSLTLPRAPPTPELDVEGRCVEPESTAEEASPEHDLSPPEADGKADLEPPRDKRPSPGLAGAILFSPSTYPVEHRWVKRSQARALHELKTTRTDGTRYDYFHTSPPTEAQPL